MIHEKNGKHQEAADSYKKSMDTCQGDPKNQLVKSATYKKSGSNYAVCLEKLNQREDALLTLESL